MLLAGGDEIDLVGRRPRGEGEDDALEDQRQAGARGESGLHQSVAVGQRRGQASALVGDPPQSALVRQDEEAPVEVGVVIDVEIPATADDEGVIRPDAVDLAREVEDELVGAVRIDLRPLGPGQIAHRRSPCCSGAVCRARERECSGKAVQPLDQDNGRTAAERLDGWFDPQRDTVPDVQ